MTNRSLDASLEAELIAAKVRPARLFKAGFSTGTLLLWDGDGDLSFGGDLYLGNGYLQGIGAVTEQAGTEANDLLIEVPGSVATLRAIALNNGNFPGTCELRLAALDATGAIVGTPYLLYKGELDLIQMGDDAQDPVIQFQYVPEFANLEKILELRYTDALQKIFDATDNGFEYVAALADKPITWGFSKRRKKTPKTAEQKAKRKKRRKRRRERRRKKREEKDR